MKFNLNKIGMKQVVLILGCFFMILAGSLKVINYIEVKKSDDKFKAALEQESNQKDSSSEVAEMDEEIGRLIIPSLNIEGVIVEGIDDESIKHNIGHFPYSGEPGQEGNFAVAGHRGTLYNNVFDNLHKVKIDDEVIVETLKGTYVYKVKEQFIVAPEETEVLNNTPGVKEITIVTCTLDGKERLIVKGTLVEEEKNE
ncbi:class D sortase [Clostridium culturomicium]|uniref:class D sortase n=1 Tax=Clostridium culturomicium TaxID=1499683 RepID=UPI003857BFA0